MKLTITLERSDLVGDAATALAAFLDKIPDTAVTTGRAPRVPAAPPALPPTAEAGDTLPAAAAPAAPAAPVASAAAPAAPSPQATTPTAAEAPTAPVVPQAATGPGKDAVMEALRSFAQQHGREKAIEVLKAHGAANVSALDPARYDEVLIALMAA